jgi:hypothetical protein
MVPGKLQRYLHKKHTDCKDKPVVFFKRECHELEHSQSNLASVIKDGNVCEASYKVSYHIALCGEAFTIAENVTTQRIEDAV